MSKNWIQKAINRPGALHHELSVPDGESIPRARLVGAIHSKNPLLRRRARLAMTLKHFGKGRK